MARERDDDYDDRPRRRDRDDDDYDDRPRGRQLTGMDAFYTSSFVLAILMSVFCSCVGLIVNIIGVTSCTDTVAKKNAQMCLYISIGLAVLGIISSVMWFAVLGGGRARF